MKKPNNKQIAYLALGLIITGMVTAWIISASKRKAAEKATLGDGKDSNTDPFKVQASGISDVVFPLKYGSGYNNPSENIAVKIVQKYLNNKLQEPGVPETLLNIDGKFGPITQSVLYKIKGVKTVSYSLFKSIETELRNVSPLA